jgi:hypothetical protein
LNVFTTAVFWTLWKMRNDLCFQGLGGGGAAEKKYKNAERLVPAKQARRCRRAGAMGNGAGEKLPAAALGLDPDASTVAA